MRYGRIDEYLMAKPGVDMDFKAEWGRKRFMLAGKMFAAVCFDDNGKEFLITVKPDPPESDFLRQQYEDVIPGYYMNKTHRSSVKADGAVPDELLRGLPDESYGPVLRSFSRKKQEELTGRAAPC